MSFIQELMFKKPRRFLVDAVDTLQGKMTERGSLSSNAEKLGKEILSAFRQEIPGCVPTTDKGKTTFSFSVASDSELKNLRELLDKPGSEKALIDLNAAFAGKIKVSVNNDNYTFTLTV